MSYTRETIASKLTAALADVDRVDARLYAAVALDEVTSLSGLRYAPASPDLSTYAVACNGQALGQLWPPQDGRPFVGWTAALFGSVERIGPFHTARAAAAALAATAGVTPDPQPIPERELPAAERADQLTDALGTG